MNTKTKIKQNNNKKKHKQGSSKTNRENYQLIK